MIIPQLTANKFSTIYYSITKKKLQATEHTSKTTLWMSYCEDKLSIPVFFLLPYLLSGHLEELASCTVGTLQEGKF